MYVVDILFGVFNMVFGIGFDLGEVLVCYLDVVCVFLIGLIWVGVVVLYVVVDDIKCVSFELGGKGVCLVFFDVDLEKVGIVIV